MQNLPLWCALSQVYDFMKQSKKRSYWLLLLAMTASLFCSDWAKCTAFSFVWSAAATCWVVEPKMLNTEALPSAMPNMTVAVSIHMGLYLHFVKKVSSVFLLTGVADKLILTPPPRTTSLSCRRSSETLHQSKIIGLHGPWSVHEACASVFTYNAAQFNTSFSQDGYWNNQNIRAQCVDRHSRWCRTREDGEDMTACHSRKLVMIGFQAFDQQLFGSDPKGSTVFHFPDPSLLHVLRAQNSFLHNVGHVVVYPPA